MPGKKAGRKRCLFKILAVPGGGNMGNVDFFVLLFCIFRIFFEAHLLTRNQSAMRRQRRSSRALCCSLSGTAGQVPGWAPSGAFGGGRGRCPAKVWKRVFPVFEVNEKRHHERLPPAPLGIFPNSPGLILSGMPPELHTIPPPSSSSSSSSPPSPSALNEPLPPSSSWRKTAG